MTLEQICTSPELSQQLKEAGYPQDDSLFYWAETKVNGLLLLPRKEVFFNDGSQIIKPAYVAPTPSELGEKLAKSMNINLKLDTYLDDSGHEVSVNKGKWKYDEDLKRRFYKEKILFIDLNKSEANARAKMLLYLKKEGLITY